MHDYAAYKWDNTCIILGRAVEAKHLSVQKGLDLG